MTSTFCLIGAALFGWEWWQHRSSHRSRMLDIAGLAAWTAYVIATFLVFRERLGPMAYLVAMGTALASVVLFRRSDHGSATS